MIGSPSQSHSYFFLFFLFLCLFLFFFIFYSLSWATVCSAVQVWVTVCLSILLSVHQCTQHGMSMCVVIFWQNYTLKMFFFFTIITEDVSCRYQIVLKGPILCKIHSTVKPVDAPEMRIRKCSVFPQARGKKNRTQPLCDVTNSTCNCLSVLSSIHLPAL